MTTAELPEHYEVLQVSPRADRDTIERVFRHLAKRYHPDNGESGDTVRFAAVLEAFRVLSDPERRAQYDVWYDAAQRERLRLAELTGAGDASGDRRVQRGALKVLYQARRQNVLQPGVGIVDLERMLGCPQEEMEFHLWYLKERGFVQRLETGRYAITAAGVDRVLDDAEAPSGGLQLLRSGVAAEPARVAAEG